MLNQNTHRGNLIWLWSYLSNSHSNPISQAQRCVEFNEFIFTNASVHFLKNKKNDLFKMIIFNQIIFFALEANIFLIHII